MNYTISKSIERSIGDIEETVEDTLSVQCTEGSDRVYVDGQYRNFSKCKYGKEPLTICIHSEDGGVVAKNQYITYDGKPHGVVVDNQHEFENMIAEKSTEYDAVNNPSGIVYVNSKTGQTFKNPPVEPGTYSAYIEYYHVSIENGKQVVNPNIKYQILANSYEIRGVQLPVNVGSYERQYDGTNRVDLTDC